MQKAYKLFFVYAVLPSLIALTVFGCGPRSSRGGDKPDNGHDSFAVYLSDGTPVPEHFFKYYKGEGYDDAPAAESARMLAALGVMAGEYGLALGDEDAASARKEAGDYLEDLRDGFAAGDYDGELSYDEMCAARYDFGFEELAGVYRAVKLSGMLRAFILSAQELLVTDEMISGYASANPSEASCAFLFAFAGTDPEGPDPEQEHAAFYETLKAEFEKVDSAAAMLEFIYGYSEDSEKYENNIITSDELSGRIGEDAAGGILQGPAELSAGGRFTAVTEKGIYFLYCIESDGGGALYDTDAIRYEIARGNAERIIAQRTAELLKQDETDGKH